MHKINFIPGVLIVILNLLAVTAQAAGETAEQLYQIHCFQCHGKNREGGFGPNLQDATWLLGEPTASSVTKIIQDGVTNKGMPAWKNTLTPDQITVLTDWLLQGKGKADANGNPVNVLKGDELNRIRLPKDFVISIYADNLQTPRALAVDDGIVYVATSKAGKIYALQDTNKDFIADKVHTLASNLKNPIGIAVNQHNVYVGEQGRILRFNTPGKQLGDNLAFDVIKSDLPDKDWHGGKAIEIGPDSKIYIPVGVPCNVCEESEAFGKIWRMNLDGSQYELFAKGLRNSVGLAWHPVTQELWFTDNGRDLMADNIPSCELNYAPKAGLHFGFPYCHGGNVLDPEFGKNKHCEDYISPVALLGPHVAPLGLGFYTGNQFPSEYQNQLFIAEHGSWNRSQKIGYRVSLVTLMNNKLVSDTEFANFMPGDEVLARPVDIAFLPDGSMLVSDDYGGRIYRISYIGQKPSILKEAVKKLLKR